MLDLIHIGLGAIGRETVWALLARPTAVRLLAIVDTHPQFINQSLADIIDGAPAIPIVPSIAEARRLAPTASVAILTTGSRIPDIKPTLEQLADARLHVVSSCEELAFPALRHPQLAGEIDAYARDRGVAILGTGVNPGFAMDAFALMSTAVCSSVNTIAITRTLDAGKRRRQLQMKVGAGLTLKQANMLIADGKLGHVGLAESAALLATGLGWTFDNIDEQFLPVLAESEIKAEFVTILPGQVRGMRMTAVAVGSGSADAPPGKAVARDADAPPGKAVARDADAPPGKAVARDADAPPGKAVPRKLISLELTMAFGAETFDDIAIEATPPIHVRVLTGFPGESSTTSLMINSANAIRRLSPGLRTMLDLVPLRSLGV